MKRRNHICLCEHCIEAIRSRGERVIELGTIADGDENLHCDWCEEECPTDELYDCAF